MPGRRTDALGRRAVVAVAIPTVAAGVAGALTLASPANAASPTPLPFPTSVCGTSTPSSATASASASSSASRSASATPSKSTSTSAAPQVKNLLGSTSPASPSASASASDSMSAAATPTPSPSASTSSSSGGFWGWLNGVWTWIFGSAQLPHAAAAPVLAAADLHSGTGTGTTKAKTTTAKSVTLVKAAAVASTSSTPSPSASASCVPSSALKVHAAISGGDIAAQIPWHLTTPSMTMYNLTYNGITTVKTINGSLKVLDFTADKVTLLSMVTFSHQSGTELQYVDGGPNQTVTLNTVHLLTTTMSAKLFGTIPVTFSPTSPPPLPVGLTFPIGIPFTDVQADNAFLTTQSIVIPGFNGHGGTS